MCPPGVAFEQGKLLPTPETVPFRLTRDIVDAMGVAGTEGVFRRCFEATMKLLHSSKEELLTITQVREEEISMPLQATRKRSLQPSDS